MDPLTSAVVTLLGKYVVDKGASLLKEAGQAAVDAAAKLFEKVMGKLKADPAEAKTAERFEQNPEAMKAAVEIAVDEKAKAEPDFAAELKKLVEEFEQAKSAAVSQMVAGSGAAASDHSVAAGAGGVAFQVGGSVGGGIVVGKDNKPNEKNG